MSAAVRPLPARLAAWRPWIAAAVLAVLLGYVVWPQVLVYLRAFGVEAGAALEPSLQPWRETLASSLNRQAVVNSLLVSVLSVLLAGFLGIGAALLHERLRFPGRGLVFLASVLPLTLPPLVGVMAFARLVGFGGIVPRFLGRLTGISPMSLALLDVPGILAVHTYSFSVYFFVLTKAGLAHLDPSQELAARSLGAGFARRARRVILPALLPYLVSAALLTFMVSMGSYSAPKYMTSGTPYLPILTVEIAYQYESANFTVAAVLAALLSILCVAVLAGLQFGLRGAWRQEGGGTKGAAGRMLSRRVESPAGRAGLGLFAAVYFLAMAAPLAVILLTSLADMTAWNAAASLLPPRLTLDNYAEVFSRRGAFMHPILVSLFAAGAATALNLVLGVASAFLIARGGRTLRLGVDVCSMLPLSLPGTVIAFNVVVAFGTGGSLWTGGAALRNTFWILVLVYFVRQIPLALRPLGASMARVDPLYERAARSLGAGPVRTFFRIVMPQLWTGMLAAGLVCFVTGMGEFVASVLVWSIRWKPISIEIAAALADSEGLGPASAYAALLMFMTAGSLLVYGWLARRT